MSAATASWPTVSLDRDLIYKYDGPGPRYTSYPTAPNFRDFGPEDYRGLLEKSAESGRQLSIYLHLPFCRTLCFYCGCNVTISKSPKRGRQYLDLLKQEVARTAELLAADRREVVQIHLGGGTPNFFPPAELRELFAHLRGSFRLHEDCEIGVEVDPRTCSAEHLDAFAQAGVNRLSAGLQDLQPQVQEAINRLQSAEATRAVVDGAHQRGIESVNVDLIYGLPHQSAASFSDTLDEALDMGSERFAIFNFAYLPKMLRHQRVIDPDSLPSPDEKLNILEAAIHKLTAAGYVMIGMDHFARPEDPLSQALLDRTLTRNFQGYSTWGETDLVAFGASAIGLLGGGFAQNTKDVADYEEAIAAGRFATCKGYVLTEDDHLRRDVIQELMCHLRLDFDEVGRRHGIDFKAHFGPELATLAPLAEDGLLDLDENGVTVTPAGHLLVRNVAMAFDAYLPKNRETTTFSRTV